MIPKKHARELSKKIPGEVILEMLKKAQSEVTNWKAPCRVNKNMSRGKLWNMFATHFDPVKKHEMVVYRLIEEFGDFLPEKYHPVKKKKKESETLPYHEDPIFL